MSVLTRQARSAAANARREGTSCTIIPADGSASVSADIAMDSGATYLDDDTGAYETAPLAHIAIDEVDLIPVPGDLISYQGDDWMIDRIRPVAGMWQIVLREMI